VELNLPILRAIHDAAVDAIVVINRHGIIQTVNPAAIQMFGYQEAELIGQNVSLLMPPPMRQEHDGYIAHFLETRIPRIIGIGREVEAMRKDGTLLPVHLAVSEIQENGVPVFAGYIRDLSQYTAAEQEMRAQMLINERLATIGQTVSGLAHESRNALQRSHACLAVLELDLEGMPHSLKLVRKVQQALDDLHLLLEEVRNYAAPIILERRSWSIEQLVREVWQNLIDAKGEAQAPRFHVDIQDGFPRGCLLDVDRFRRVIRNLFDNAWFACSEPKSVQVNLRHKTTSDLVPSWTCWLEIIDNGSGVAEEDRDKIFAPFYTTKTKGTGLGLALSRRYVEAHNGRIFVEDAIKQTGCSGAKFVVEFPNC
jgi:two-component system sensor kinase FixL